MEIIQLKPIIQAVLLAAGRTLKISELAELFEPHEQVKTEHLQQVLSELQVEAENQCFTLKELASGYSYQVKADYSQWLARLWAERPQRYTRAFLETLVIIAYRQPVSRGDIEEIRGVAVSSNTIRTLLEREWIRVVGHRDAPGKPAIFATTKTFLDYFNLKSLAELPTLDEIKNIDEISQQLNIQLEIPNAENSETQMQEREEHEVDVNHEQAIIAPNWLQIATGIKNFNDDYEHLNIYADQDADLEVI